MKRLELEDVLCGRYTGFNGKCHLRSAVAFLKNHIVRGGSGAANGEMLSFA